jgi:hypothetical protein
MIFNPFRRGFPTDLRAARPVRSFYATLISAALLLAPFAARAAVTATDIQVVGRILHFTTPPLSGRLKMGIVYDPTDPVSRADERIVAGILGTGLGVGNVILVPVPIPIANIANIPADFLFLTSGLGRQARKVGARAAAAKILCVTTDLAATRAGGCAVSVETGDTVQITVDTAAAADSGIMFSTAFTMLTTQF